MALETLLIGPLIGAIIAGFGYAVNKAKNKTEEKFDPKNFFITVGVGTALYTLGDVKGAEGLVNAVGGDVGFTALFTFVVDTLASLWHK